ncbi:LpqB family beta-propeller domain-containing protein [Allobranchiibius sp. CTAmp26]|uniref:LpqB family beta-propeller domain-containing protein n=1 Tax=Allobranchiibius sp. CTAmp26 TaxID=2815214 RepID=UPI001AA1A28B|nr:LpqB family beta-propeller domain-containing protein [Allobranchiibius sp. CTAmp26]MBO1755589.1 hypothetical protein [Allobranchiibius sp. CTAmp26]
MRVGAVRVRWLWALLLPVTLTGCAGLPTSGAVHAEQPINNAAAPHVDVQVLGPVDGQSPQDVVNSFLLAGVSLDDDYGVARQYMTATASAKWQPAEGAIITGAGDFRVAAPKSGRVVVSAVQQAVLDTTGHVSARVPGVRFNASFGVTKVRGQWRVSSLPTGFRPWISDANFQQVFTAQRIYYPSASSRVLVPDVQWYPSAGLATAVARAVLAAPPPWLRGVLRTPSQSHIGLAINAVPVDPNTNVASIDLTASAQRADAATRTALWAAMTASLTAMTSNLAVVPSVTRVELTVRGNRLAAPHLPAQPMSAADLGYQVASSPNAALIIRNGSVLTRQRSDASGPLRGSGDTGATPARLPVVGSKFYDLSADASGGAVAALSTDRRSLGVWVGRTLHTVPTFAGNLTRPTFTGTTALLAGISGTPRRGTAASGAGVWAADTTAGSRIGARRLSVPWLGRSVLLALKVSAEGARVAMVVQDDEGRTSVRVAGLLRDARGAPTAIGTPVVMPVGIASISDVAWLDDATLGVLGATAPAKGRARGADQIALVPLSGQPEIVGAPSGVQNVVSGGSGPDDIYVLDHRGSVWTRQGAGWARIPGADDLAAPGT